MYRIEKLQEGTGRGRWVPVDDAKYPSLERARQARTEAVQKALREAPAGAWRTPRFRIVEAAQVAVCSVLQ